jgi:murein DD-endopeptidase MepM/ murein hydrolase activator NlpD
VTITPTQGIGSNGGTVASADGNAVLVIPPGSLSAPVDFTVQLSSSSPPEAVLPVYAIGPGGTQFSPPATLTLRYTPASLPAGFAPTDLVIAIFTADGLIELPTTHDVANATASAPVPHLTDVGFAPKSATTMPPLPTLALPMRGDLVIDGFLAGERDHVGADRWAVDLRPKNVATVQFPDDGVFAAGDGRLAFVGWNCQRKNPSTQLTCYGYTVAIEHAGGFYSIYTHLACNSLPGTTPAFCASVNESAASPDRFKEIESVRDTIVHMGDRIGTVLNSGCFGNCGNPGTHLHFSVHHGKENLRGCTGNPGSCQALWWTTTAVNIWTHIRGLPNPQREGQILVKLAPPFGGPVVRGSTFYQYDTTFHYVSGTMTLAGDPPPFNRFGVDDGMRLFVTAPDGLTRNWVRTFNSGCVSVGSSPPENVTTLFPLPGDYTIRVEFFDVCGVSGGTGSAIYLTNELP